MQDNAMTQSIEEAIAKNLPEHISKVLRERLAQADAALLERQNLTTQLSETKAKLKSELELETLKTTLDSRAAKVTERERSVSDSEEHMRVTALTTQLECEKRLTTILQATLTGLVRNTTYRENAFGNVPIINNGYAQGSASSSTSTDRTAE